MNFRRSSGKIAAYARSLVNIALSISSGVIFFIILARALGPERFGDVAIVFAQASIISIIIDYGYQQRILVSHADYVRDYGGIPPQVYQLKILITLIISIILFCFSVGVADGVFPIMFFLGSCALSFANLFSYGIRSEGLMVVDTKNQILSTFILLIPSLFLLFAGLDDIRLFAAIYMMSQVVYLILSAVSYSRIAILIIRPFRISSIAAELRNNCVFALDVFVVRAYSFIDITLLGMFSNSAQVGHYQAGQKLYTAAQLPMQAINNVLLPKLKRSEGYKSSKLRSGILLSVTGIGLSAAIPFFLFSNQIINIVYGESYQDLVRHMPLFAIIIVLRYIAFSQSIILTASGNQRLRFYSNLISLIVFISMAFIFIPTHDVSGLLISLIVSTLFLCAGYAASIKVVKRY